MAPPLDRRDFLKTVAIGSAVVGLSAGPAAAADVASFDPTVDAAETWPVDPALVPFGHGVMSGDPLPDRVVLWTRITIPDARGFDATAVTDPQGITSVQVGWVAARDPGLSDVVRAGTVTTTAARDWTVKVDADALPAATTLYYAFTALGYRSPIGRTRTAPAVDADVGQLTVAHVSCTSWWQDVFNTFARIGERNDLDVITHAGDHIYDSCGGHPASRYWKNQRSWDGDIDNRDMTSVYEARRRYALYYTDPALLRAHLAAPFIIMADQHDYDPAANLTMEQAGTVFYEWTPTRQPIPDGTGRQVASAGPDTNMALPTGRAALYVYRTFSFGRLAELILWDVRRFADVKGQSSQVLGDEQWSWLQGAFRASKTRGARFNYVVNQVNLGQLRGVNLPGNSFAQMFGFDPNAQGPEIYATAWGAHPAERTRLLQFLRAEGIKDNVVVSGDSHGFFGYDLVEDPSAPAYEPATGGGTLGAVGVEMVPSAQGRPGGQDVLAEMAYFTRTGGSRGAAFNDAGTYDAVDRPAVLAATIGIEQAAKAANLNLIYFNWKAEYGYTMVHLRRDATTLENFTTPQRVVSADQTLLAQFRSPKGAPHLGQVLQPSPVRAERQDAPVPQAQTVRAHAEGPAPVVPELPAAVLAPLAAAVLVGGSLVLRRRGTAHPG